MDTLRRTTARVVNTPLPDPSFAPEVIMKHTAFAFGFASLVAASAAQPRQVSAGTLGDDDVGRPAGQPVAPVARLAPPVIQPVVAVSAEIAMPVIDVHTWTPATRARTRREHARLHDAAVRAGLATLLAPAPGQANISLRRPLLGRDLRPMSGNVMPMSKGKGGSRNWTDDE
jgi:hypothetical protein